LHDHQQLRAVELEVEVERLRAHNGVIEQQRDNYHRQAEAWKGVVDTQKSSEEGANSTVRSLQEQLDTAQRRIVGLETQLASPALTNQAQVTGFPCCNFSLSYLSSSRNLPTCAGT
jgi:hypothetical protein